MAVTARGVAAFVHVHMPDTEGKYADNKYKITLKFKKGDPEAEKTVAMIRELEARAVAEQKEKWKKKKLEAMGAVKDGDERADEEDKYGDAGTWQVTFKSNDKPKLVDSKRKPLTGRAKIRNGDVVKVDFGYSPFKEAIQGKGGISLYLNAVQLLEKRSVGFDGNDGFEEEEGYEVPEDEDASEDHEAEPDDETDDGL